MFLSEWREFPSAPCLAGKKNLKTARVSMLLKSRATLTCFRPCFLSGRAKDLSTPRYLWVVHAEQILHPPFRQLVLGNGRVAKNCKSEHYSCMKYNFIRDFAHLISYDKDSSKCLCKAFKQFLRRTRVNYSIGKPTHAHF